jgi:N-acetylmuramoyl-L-alanine amidase
VIDRTAPQSKKLADCIHGQFKRSVVKRFKMVDRGVKPGLFYVLALSKIPAVLLEVGFISNEREMKKLTSSKFQNSYAGAVSRGILKYVKSVKKESVPLF